LTDILDQTRSSHTEAEAVTSNDANEVFSERLN